MMQEILRHCAGLSQRSFERGEIVLEDGTKTGLLFILAEGSVEVLKGEVQITTVAEPGAFLGEISALLGLPHTATVKTLEPSRFFVVEKPTEFLRSQPEIALSLSRLLAQRLNYVTGYLVDLKTQFEGSQDHLGMVDEILESLVHHQEPADAEDGPSSD